MWCWIFVVCEYFVCGALKSARRYLGYLCDLGTVGRRALAMGNLQNFVFKMALLSEDSCSTPNPTRPLPRCDTTHRLRTLRNYDENP